MTRIYDCFSFFNELDLLEIRLEELYDTVNYFVISESTVTHSGKPKPLYFQENAARFAKYQQKIRHIVVDDMPDQPQQHWDREKHQRNALIRGLYDCKPQDRIIISDLDEIPRAAAVREVYPQKDQIVVLSQKPFLYHLNLRGKNQWTSAKIINFEELGRPGLANLSEVRLAGWNVTIPDAGWHFSFVGSLQRVKSKLESFAHQELNLERFKQDRRIRVAAGTGLGTVANKSTEI